MAKRLKVKLTAGYTSMVRHWRISGLVLTHQHAASSKKHPP
jgi:hypothetical protein